jgi:hypothetical protein
MTAAAAELPEPSIKRERRTISSEVEYPLEALMRIERRAVIRVEPVEPPLTAGQARAKTRQRSAEVQNQALPGESPHRAPCPDAEGRFPKRQATYASIYANVRSGDYSTM